MSRDIEYVQSALPNPAVYGNYKPIENNVEDHGPFYLYSVGEPVHRVSEKDSVPHLYAGLVTPCPDFGRWYLADTLEISSSVIATNSEGKKVTRIPEYAGSIKNRILTGYKHQGVVSLDAFARVKEESLNLPFFNSHLMPVPIFYGNDDLPVKAELPTEMKELFGVWEARFKDYEMVKQREEMVKGVGGLAARRMQAEAFLTELRRGDYQSEISIPLAQLYEKALLQILSSFETFSKFAVAYLAKQDRDMKDGEHTGKYVYDERDVRLQWLMNLRGIDAPIVEQLRMNQPQVVVQMPEQVAAASDIERKPCPRCAERIGVEANFCRYCSLDLTSLAQAAGVAVGAESVTVTEAKPKGRPKNVVPEKVTDDPLI
jgi:hypothetical protein